MSNKLGVSLQYVKLEDSESNIVMYDPCNNAIQYADDITSRVVSICSMNEAKTYFEVETIDAPYRCFSVNAESLYRLTATQRKAHKIPC